MAKLKCTAHGRRVLVLGAEDGRGRPEDVKVLHRTGDGSPCGFPVVHGSYVYSGPAILPNGNAFGFRLDPATFGPNRARKG